MKIVISGPRDYNKKFVIFDELDKLTSSLNIEPSIVITGGATGVDTCANEWAVKREFDVLIKYADWNKFGKSAGPRRNKEMANLGDVLFVFRVNGLWSRGSRNMYSQMIELGKPVYIIDVI